LLHRAFQASLAVYKSSEAFQMSVSRRELLGLLPLAILPAVVKPTPISATAQSTKAIDVAFPAQPYALVRETVIASHGNVARVKELVGRSPALANASIDWGYGDWEDALGASSHVGNREIAEFLLANGARPSIFSAAMLGQLDVVKAMIAARPGVEATHGPHSIPLLRHAMAGGAAAQPVVDYLKTLPAADRKPPTQPITSEQMTALVGTYSFGEGPTDQLIVAIANPSMTSNGWSLTIARQGGSPRGLAHLGDRVFYPAGAASVRIRFSESAGRLKVSVSDPDLIVTAEKAV
jgi:hypothetical protein